MSTQLKLHPRSTEAAHADIAGPEHDVPVSEPWLKVSLTGFVPLVLAFYLPAAYRPIPFLAGGLLVLCGMFMLIRQERRRSWNARG